MANERQERMDKVNYVIDRTTFRLMLFMMGVVGVFFGVLFTVVVQAV